MRWVKPPKSGHALVMVGTALAHFTGADLVVNDDRGVKSSVSAGCSPVLHRVVPAPGAQAKFSRYALGYFVRPEDDVLLRKLSSSSSSEVMRAKNNTREGNGRNDDLTNGQPLFTAKEWISDQAGRLGIGRESSFRAKKGFGTA
jgi:hypothetical protein